jgi:hypothetical protein
MAELNFGLLTPPGSQSIGNAFAQGMDQAAVARAQENQNALAQYTLGKAKREDEQQNELYAAVRQPGFKLDIGTAMRFGAPGLAAYKTQQEADKSNVDIAYTKAKTGASQFELAQKRTNKAIIDISNLPDSETALSSIDRHLAAGDIDEAKATALKGKLGNQETFLSGRTEIIMGMLEAKDRLPYEKITTTTTNLGDVSREQQVDAFGRKIGAPTVTPIGVSANTTATLAQAQQHFNGLSAYQKEQLRVQGKQFDSDRGVIVDVKNGTFEPVYSYPSSTPSAPAAPAAIPAAPSAAPAGTPITQPRVATAGTFPRDTTVQQTNRMEGATAIRRQELSNEQNALENARQKLASPAAANDPDIRRFYEERFKEATNNIAALNKELGNQPTQPSATQPAQRTVLGPKPEKATESYFKELKGVINTNDAINNLKQMVSTFTPADMLNPARRAEIDTAHKTAVLLAKEMFNLGVLNGGDQKILEQVIPDPISFSKGLVPIETIRKNLDAASSVASRMNATLSKVHKQPLVQLDTIKPNAPNTSAPPIESFRRR